MPPVHQGPFIRDLRTAQAAACDVHIANGRTVTLYSYWTTFYSNLQVNHLLEYEILPSVKIIQVYGHQVRHDHYSSRSKLLWAESVATAGRAIAKTHILEGRHDPRNLQVSHSKDLDKLLTKMLRHFLYQYMPPKREKSILLGLIMAAAEAADISCTFDPC